MSVMKMQKVFRYLLISLFWLMLWWVVSALVDRELLLPSPVSTFRALIGLFTTANFYLSATMSILRIVAGYIIGVVLGVLSGVASAYFNFFNILFLPLRSIIKATPVSSFIILLLLWFSVGTAPVITAFLIVFPIIHVSVYEGITSTDPLLVEMANFFNVSPTKKLRVLYASTVRTRFTAAAVNALGFAWKAGVAAEVLATPQYSIGANLYDSKIYLETPELFAWTGVVIVLSVILEKLILFLVKKSKRRNTNLDRDKKRNIRV